MPACWMSSGISMPPHHHAAFIWTNTEADSACANGRAYQEAGTAVPLELLNTVLPDVAKGLRYLNAHPSGYQHLE